MTLGALIIALVLVGLVLYLVNNFIPMDPKVKNILNIIVIIVLVIWLVQAFGLLNGSFFNTPIRRS